MLASLHKPECSHLGVQGWIMSSELREEALSDAQSTQQVLCDMAWHYLIPLPLTLPQVLLLRYPTKVT
jgi:hypothetical protein